MNASSVIRPLSSVIAFALVAACGTDLPQGTEHFTIGRVVVRTDSVLDFAGVVYRIHDTAQVPPRGPVRHWMQDLATERNAPAFDAVRAPGPMPVSMLLETYSNPEGRDSVCGMVAPTVRRCFSGNEPMRARVRAYLDAARAYAPRLASFDLEGLSADDRRRDLADVYVALTSGASIDSAVAAWSGYADLRFDVTLARSLRTGGTGPNVDPARPVGEAQRIYLTPDAVFQTRAYRSPTYVWLALGHQMAHAVVKRLLTERPELLQHGWQLKAAVEPEMARVGYAAAFWDDVLEEQLARAITIRIVGSANPTIVWAARSDALLETGMNVVPWFEDVLSRYEAHRDSFPTLSALAPVLSAALDSVPLDSCRAAPNSGTILVGVDRHRAVLGWISDSSPFRGANLLPGDTVTAVDGDSVSAGGLLVPTRQIAHAWARHLPYELGILDIRRGGRDYSARAPISFVLRHQVRIASQAPSTTPADTVAVCRWNTRAMRR